MTATLLQHAKPDQLVELMLPHLWVSIVDAASRRTCAWTRA
ncbi:hypothetical protein [Streptomyces sp. PSKA30]|nr:hypothetical protein [Streptomyces sp. PSKA30]